MAALGRTYKHKKSGHLVSVIHIGKLQTNQAPTEHLCDMQWMVVYIHDLKVWIRSEKEFDDGRFELVHD